MRGVAAPAPAVNAAATVTSVTSPAAVQYTFTAADTATAGPYLGSWHVTFADASTMTFPTGGYLDILIEPDLAGGANYGSDYTDTATLKQYLAIGDTVRQWDNMLAGAVTAASRAVDAHCQRKFWLDPTPVAKTFTPDTLLDLDLASQDPWGGDIGTTNGLTVATDPSGDGTYDIVWAAGDYHLLPNNAASATPEARPWTALRAVGTRTFPWLVNTWLTRLDRVQVTARWGWPAVPQAVTQSAIIKAARLFHRKDSPQGVMGFGEFGPVRLSRQEDSDVIGLLATYRREAVMVA